MNDNYFLHGDRNSETGLYFCHRCDEFAGQNHFADAIHIGERDRRVNDSLNTLRRFSANRPGETSRSNETVNLFAEQLPANISKRLVFSESFLSWLSHSTDNTRILEAVRDHPIRKAAPTYDDVLEILEEEDQAALEVLYEKYVRR